MTEFFAGCIGGGAGVLVGHPFDTIKVRMQKSPFKYTGAIHCARMIVTKESVNGLYKGLLSPLYGLAFMNAIVFGVQGNVQRRISDTGNLLSHSIGGFVAGIAQSFICSPTELVKIRMQNQGEGVSLKELKKSSHTYYKGPLDCLFKIYQTEGIYGGVFRGLWLTCIREGPSFALYFPIFHGICRYFTPLNEKYGIKSMLFAGGISGVVTWLSTYPVDMVKTRFQDDPKHEYKSIKDCIVKTYKAGGTKIFFQGLNVTLIRAFPVNAATFTVTTWILQSIPKDKWYI